MDAGNNSKMRKGKASRHTPQQIQRLEAFFRECRNPNENQRRQLSRELGLGQNQIKFWFQNKRNQTKVHSERVDNNSLRSENERLQDENMALTEILKNAICPTCDDHPTVTEEERKLNIEKLKRENSELREEYERIANEITRQTGKPISHLLSLPPESLEHLLSLPAEGSRSLGQQSGSSSGPGIDSGNSDNPVAAYEPFKISEDEKIKMIQNAANALNELAELMMVFEPLWVMSPTYGGYVLHEINYSKVFCNSRHLRCRSSRIESSKDWAVVPIAASDLVEMLLDARKWADLFPTIVMEAKAIATLDTGSIGGSLNLMYERTHILSSLVAPREFIFLRYCQEVNPGTWFIVDASYDCCSEIQDMLHTASWRFPSGLMIESLSNRKSKVTWVDHVEVDESLNHPLYRNLLSSVHGYGAKRWLSALERMLTRSLYSLRPGSINSRGLGEGMNSNQGRKNFMALSHRMIRDFCAILSMPRRPDLSESAKYIKISVRDDGEPGQPHGIIVSASTTIWLPLTFENLFNFLRDECRRPEWDVFLNGRPVNAISSMPTGNHPGNCISIIEPYSYNERMLVLQENSIDPVGGLLVFATVDKHDITSVMNGEDSSKIPILPCGFLISSDGTPSAQGSGGASTSTGNGNSTTPFGSLLTLTFQMAVTGNSEFAQNHKATADTLITLVTTTIQKLKGALGCF